MSSVAFLPFHMCVRLCLANYVCILKNWDHTPVTFVSFVSDTISGPRNVQEWRLYEWMVWITFYSLPQVFPIWLRPWPPLLFWAPITHISLLSIWHFAYATLLHCYLNAILPLQLNVIFLKVDHVLFLLSTVLYHHSAKICWWNSIKLFLYMKAFFKRWVMIMSFTSHPLFRVVTFLDHCIPQIAAVFSGL